MKSEAPDASPDLRIGILALLFFVAASSYPCNAQVAGFYPTPAWTGPEEATYSVALGDIDGDGALDLLRGNLEQGATLYLNNGSQFSSTPAWTGPVEFTKSVALGDIDGDGDLDLVRGNYDEGATLYLNNGSLFSSSPAWIGPIENTYSVALGDIDGDGDLDLVRGNFRQGATLYLNNGSLFSSTPAWTGPAEFTYSVAFGDIDGDGDLDLVRGNSNNLGATLYLNNGSMLTSNRPHVRSVQVCSVPEGRRRITFISVDHESAPLWLVGHYQFEGSPAWYPVTLGGSTSLRSGPWTASPTGIEHEVTWDISMIPPDRRNVILRLRAVSSPGGAGIAPVVSSYRVNAGPLNVSVSSLPLVDSRGDLPVGEDTRVVISLPKWVRFVEGQLFYRHGGGGAYDSTALQLSEVLPGTYSPVGTIPATEVGPRGIEYWVRLRTTTTTVTDPAFEPTQNPHSFRTKILDLIENEEHRARNYRMVSVPLDLDLPETASLASILSDEPEFGPYDPRKWRAFRYSPGDSSYREVTSSSADDFLRPVPGRAFWLTAAATNRFNTAPVPGRSVPSDSTFAVTLEPGWNQVGNPFAFPVAWDDVTWDGPPGAVEPPCGWDEAGQRYDTIAATALDPFSGYWVMNTTNAPVTLRIPPREAARPATAVLKAYHDEPGAWSIQVVATTGAASDASNFAGVAPAGLVGTDLLDRSDPPPAPGSGVSLYFLGKERGAHPLTRDIRPPLDNGSNPAARGSRWVFDVALIGEETQPADVTLAFEDLGRVPSDLDIRLVDHDLERTEDLRRQNQYSYVGVSTGYKPGGKAARFELMVGTTEYLLAAGFDQATAAPRTTRLLPNHPNPFLSGTVIRFETARPGPVQVFVFDVTGRLLRTLVDGVRDPGIHEVVRQGEDDRGRPVAPGVYFIRFAAPGGTGTEKLVKTR